MNPNWGNQWQQPSWYQPAPHPHVYIPPQHYARPANGYWSAWAPTVPLPNTAYQPQPPPPRQPFYHPRPRSRSADSVRSSKYPTLNPILAADTTLMRFDVKRKPRDDIFASTYYTNRQQSALVGTVSHMRIISKAFPWTIEIRNGGAPGTSITCEYVWDAIYAALQEFLADSEWGMVVGDKDLKKRKEGIEKAAKKREEKDYEKRYKRIDWLGENTLFKGLEKDEEFAKQRMMPGAPECAETWVLKLA